MKELYTKPVAEVEEFEAIDILTTVSTTDAPGIEPLPEEWD